MTNYKNFIINKKFISSLVFLRLLYLSSTAQAAGLPYFEPKSVVGENKVESLSVEDDNVALTISIGRGRGKSAVSEKKVTLYIKEAKVSALVLNSILRIQVLEILMKYQAH